MDAGLNEEYVAFRNDVRAFLDARWRTEYLTDAQAARAFRKEAIAKGFLYRHVPAEYGGGGCGSYDPLRASIAQREFNAVGARAEMISREWLTGPFILVPTLLAAGSEWQKKQFIEATLLGDISWCQGFSEPGAGSDLVSLRTKAVLTQDEWVIDGQKIWTSNAREADFMFMLARTEPEAPPHKGLSFLLLDMKSAGIKVRPLKQLDGTSGFNEVFLDAVKTPASWIVGNRGEGWVVARAALRFERAILGSPEMYARFLEVLRQLARDTVREGQSLMEDSHFQQAFAKIEGQVLAHTYSDMRQTSMEIAGQSPGIAGLLNKLCGTQIGYQLAGLASEVIGNGSLVMPKAGASIETLDLQSLIMRSMAMAIAGGSSNIQRNVIAERGLGLPRGQGAPK